MKTAARTILKYGIGRNLSISSILTFLELNASNVLLTICGGDKNLCMILSLSVSFIFLFGPLTCYGLWRQEKPKDVPKTGTEPTAA